MRHYHIVILIILTVSCRHKTTKFEDVNGIKNFNIGADISIYDGHLTKLSNDNNSRIETYLYDDDENNTVLGRPWNVVSLDFFNNRLCGISISFELKESDDINLLLELENKFGKSVIYGEKPIKEEIYYTNLLDESCWNDCNYWKNKDIAMAIYSLQPMIFAPKLTVINIKKLNLLSSDI